MPEWAQLLSTFTVLGLAVGWLVWHWARPGRAPACSSCATRTRWPLRARGRRSPRLKILG